MERLQLAFGAPAAGIRELSDGEFLAAIQWRRTAANELVDAAQHGDVDAFCAAWLGDLQQRTSVDRMRAQTGIPHAAWSLATGTGGQRVDQLLDAVERLTSVDRKPRKSQKSKSQQPKSKSKTKSKTSANGAKPSRRGNVAALDALLRIIDCPAPPVSETLPEELIVLLELMSQTTLDLPAETYWRLWRSVFAQALELAPHLEVPRGSECSEDRRLLVCGELPWELGLLFAPVKGAGKLLKAGQRFLVRAVTFNCDGDGTPHARLLHRLPLWLAPSVRSLEWSQLFGQPLWDPESAQLFESVVETVIPFCRPDAKMALTNGSSRHIVELLQAAVHNVEIERNAPQRKYLKAVAQAAVNKTKASTRGRRADIDLMPVAQSDWSEMACMRTDWSLSAGMLVVTHHGPVPELELSIGGRPILSGEWQIELSVDGQKIDVPDEWTSVCWNSDADGDYLELQLELENGLRIDRQLMLARNDSFALLADAVCGSTGQRIEYTSRLPLATDISHESDLETRECRLTDGRTPLARIFPLALPQDRVQSTAGGFGPYASNLILKQVTAGPGIYAPQVIEWNSDFRKDDADWRTLTVTEAGNILTPGHAAGHRLRIGKQQFLFYRSLRETDASRAVLGHHTQHETVIGRFDKKGNVDPILLVETSIE